jgi:hypothetical protein
MEPKTRKWLAVGAIAGIAVSVVVFIPIIIAVSTSGSDKGPDPVVITTTTLPYGPSTTTTKPPTTKFPFNPDKLPADEKSRVNCFLEEESSFEKLTKYQCVEVRGCLYKESLYDRVPTCYFDSDNLGYKLVTDNAPAVPNQFKLQRTGKAKSPYLGEIKNLLMSTTYMETGVVRVKV